MKGQEQIAFQACFAGLLSYVAWQIVFLAGAVCGLIVLLIKAQKYPLLYVLGVICLAFAIKLAWQLFITNRYLARTSYEIYPDQGRITTKYYYFPRGAEIHDIKFDQVIKVKATRHKILNVGSVKLTYLRFLNATETTERYIIFTWINNPAGMASELAELIRKGPPEIAIGLKRN